MMYWKYICVIFSYFQIISASFFGGWGFRVIKDNKCCPNKRITGDKTTKDIEIFGISQTSNSFIQDAIAKVGPSVVRIDCERETPKIFSQFGDIFKTEQFTKVSGSGIVISADGLIVTNAHVIEKSKKMTISLSNGRTYKANVIAFDEFTDLALVKADVRTDKLVPANIGDSSKSRTGDWVIAVGNPIGLDFTVTQGIVSSPKRSASQVGAYNMKGCFIQTDAALNHGNSGGPLVNNRGEVIGINTLVRSNTEALGFSIPINEAMKIVNILKNGKKPPHSFIGVELAAISGDVAKILNDDPNAERIPEHINYGALVTKILPNTPAHSSGLRRNDVIVNINGVRVENLDHAVELIDKCSPGVTALLGVMRGETATQITTAKVIPLDLYKMLEEKRKKMNNMFVE